MTRDLRRVMMASSVGSALEWYDFFIYGTAAALVFGELFFPKLDPVVGTLAAFATFGVGFVARPLGGLVFGHLGDRIGRKPVLVLTLLLVGGGTFLIGFLPTYDQIGLWAPALLVLLRLIQGFGAGAEYGGAVLLAVEHAPPGKRGFYGSWAPVGVTVGNMAAAGVFALFAAMPKEDFLAWGWRVPFLVSIVLILFGFYIRARVTETPAFTAAQANNQPLKTPIREAVRRHPREFLVVIGARMAENGLGYLFPVFTLNYLTKNLGMEKSDVLGDDDCLRPVVVHHSLVLHAVRSRWSATGIHGRGAVLCFAGVSVFLVGGDPRSHTRDPGAYIGDRGWRGRHVWPAGGVLCRAVHHPPALQRLCLCP